ncbi:RNA polymerase sigma factor [Phytoactinopolyspora endophytica]|uniref:RNA polymerase sigma factor n=1 Tax=Phytoactinopolyspora endophytica TaxID=1642495 RepID=UPI00197C143C|nr:RNA polymerase sigma factor [Phytoactinopolyspora endophytica]
MRRYAAEANRAAVVSGAGADAEDVVQVAFVKAYQSLDRFRDGAPFRPWLLRIVVNEARNAVRAGRRRDAATERAAWLDGVSTSDADPAAAAVHAESRSALIAALRQLPEAQRQVVVCRYFLDLDEREAATVLGWPRGTVKSRLHRALTQLRRGLDEQLGGQDVAEREAEHER